jgi:adenylate cyclase
MVRSAFRGVASIRRLAAIMFTDMVGFSALTQTDERHALELLTRHNELLRPFFWQFGGREINTEGDRFLVEFESALEATGCAIEIQRFLHDHALSEPREARIQVRIGIHLGDVEHTVDDVLGDSVNIAARIEPLAEPGGICITEPVFGQVRNKIPFELQKLGPRVLKNMTFPIEVYRLVLPWTVREPPVAGSVPARLAVLPFANIGPDVADEYFADGLTEELITVLSQLGELQVIARTSVMQYRSTNKAIPQIGAELGVSSILEGSVRKAGDHLRITAQLIDVGSQGHVWAASYDRRLDDVFAVQSEIAKRVMEALKIKLRVAAAERLDARPTVRPDSYLAYLRGRKALLSKSKSSLAEAKEQFELAIVLDPRNAGAHSGLADVTRLAGWHHAGIPRRRWDESGRRSATRAVELDPNLAEAQASLGLILWDDMEYAAAEEKFRLALSLNPSYSLCRYWYAALLEEEVRPEEALQQHALAEAADPLWPANICLATELLIWLGRLDEALIKLQKLGDLAPLSEAYHLALSRYYLARAKLEPCLAELKRSAELEPEPRWRPLHRARYLALSGNKDAARVLLRREDTLPEFPHGDWAIALVYAELGSLDECFHWLAKALDSSSLPLQHLRLDPRLEGVRSDRRFRELLTKMRLA